jgi:hypothetical protein
MDQKLNEYKIEESKEDIKEIKETVSKIFSIIEGPEGLVAQNAVNKAAIFRIWWFISIIIGLIATIVYAT